MKVSLKLASFDARSKFLNALAESGYKVWVEEIKDPNINCRTETVTCFNLKHKNEYVGPRIG